MNIPFGLAGSSATYTDNSVYIDQVLTVNSAPPAAVLGNLQEALSKVLTETELDDLYVSHPDYPNPLRLIEQLRLPGFTFSTWQQFSIQENKISGRYQKAGDRLIGETLMRIAIQSFSGQSQALYVEAFLIGDFSELRQIINIVSSTAFYVPGIELSWRGFCPDPHEVYDTNYTAQLKLPSLQFPGDTIEGSETHITASFPEYDNHTKWLCGKDGSGLLNDDNIRWLASSKLAKSLLVVGSLHRIDYLDDSPNITDLYFRLCLGVLACTQIHGTAVIKISLPVNRAILGIYSLFSVFFGRMRLIKFVQHSLDDDTVYLVGSECLGIPSELFPLLLRGQNTTHAVLDYFSRQVHPLGIHFNRVFGNDMEAWIRKIEEVWNTRNI